MGPLKECISVFFKLREEDADQFWHSLISRAENVWRNRQGSSLRSGTPYVELQEIYRFLEIGAERQTGHNAKRLTELAEEVGWVKSRRRIGDSRIHAFFPDRATPTPPEEADVRFLGADGVSWPF